MNQFRWIPKEILYILTGIALFSGFTPSTQAQSKGWCEEKVLVRGADVARRVTLPAIAVKGNQVYVAYIQGNAKFIASHDGGKTWDKPIDLGADKKVCSAPAIIALDSKLVVVWPALVDIETLTAFQLFVTESVNGGKTWSAPRRVTQSRDDTFSPRFLVNRNQVLLVWLETPLAETLGKVSTTARPNFSPESVESLFNTQDNSGTVQAKLRQIRSKFYSSTYNPGSGTFSQPTTIDEIFSQRLPHIFTIYGPLQNQIFMTINQNTEIKTYLTGDGGRTWTQHFQGKDYFDPGIQLDLKIVDNQFYSVWSFWKPYQQMPVSFRTGTGRDSVQLSPPHFVRSLPRLVYSDGIFHTVWEAGQQADSWLTYMRTDKIPPTSKIIQPQSPEVLTRSVQFSWAGDDNISATDRLMYAFTYGDKEWSKLQSETTTTLKTPPDGEYVFKLRAEDVAGNIQEPVAEFKFNTFKAAPETRITQTPPADKVLNARSVEVQFEGEDNNDAPAQLTFSTQTDDQGWTDFAKGNAYTFDNLSNGPHKLRVRMKDSRGNIDPTPAECAVSIKVGLELVLSATPPLSAKDDIITFGWSAKNDKGNPVELQYSYKLDNGAPQNLQNAVRIELPNVAEGRHSFEVWGRDASGDETPRVTYKWLVDRTPPKTRASFTKNYASKFPILALDAEDPALPDNTQTATPNRYEYRIDDGAWIAFSHSGGSWPVEKPLSFYSWGYIVQIRAIDAAGNIDPNPASVDLRIFVRTNPYIFYSVVGVVVIIILYLLKMLLSKLGGGSRRRLPAASSSVTPYGQAEESSSALTEYKDDSSSSKFKFSDDDDDKDPFA